MLDRGYNQALFGSDVLRPTLLLVGFKLGERGLRHLHLFPCLRELLAQLIHLHAERIGHDDDTDRPM